MLSRKQESWEHIVDNVHTGIGPTWEHPWDQMPQCHQSAHETFPPQVGHESLGVPTCLPIAPCSHKIRTHIIQTLCPVPTLFYGCKPSHMGYLWLHCTTQEGDKPDPIPLCPHADRDTHDPDIPSPPFRQGHEQFHPPQCPMQVSAPSRPGH